MTKKNIVVLGGGFGGVSAACRLRKLLPAEHNVILIDRDRITHLCGMNPALIVGERDPKKTTRSLGRLSNRGVKFIQSEIHQLDLESKLIQTDSGPLEYDFAIVALGADYDWDAVPGSTNAYSFYNFETASRFRRKINRFKRGKIAILVAKPPYKCPPAPLETAMLLNWHFRRLLTRKNIELTLAIPEPGPIGVAGPEASNAMKAEIAKRGIELKTQAGVTEVAKNGREAKLANGDSIQADIIATVPVHIVPKVIRESGLTAGKPWVPVNIENLETATKDVFAIGDINSVPFGNDFAIPKAGVFASDQGKLTAEVIASRILQNTCPKPYTGNGGCFITVSKTQSAVIHASFLTPEGPIVNLEPAGYSGMRKRDKFESNWRRFRI